MASSPGRSAPCSSTRATKATSETTLDLFCAGGSACGGRHADLALDDINCGACGHICDGEEMMPCDSGACGTAWSECIDGAMMDWRPAKRRCQSFGESCVREWVRRWRDAHLLRRPRLKSQGKEGPQVQSPCDVGQSLGGIPAAPPSSAAALTRSEHVASLIPRPP